MAWLLHTFLLTGAFLTGAPEAVAGTLGAGGSPMTSDQTIALPSPRSAGPSSLEETLHRRRSVRDFVRTPITLADLSQLLWAAQGRTHDDGLRTAPSAGALYPLELYVVAGAVRDLPAGLYRYVHDPHRLATVRPGDLRSDIAAAALQQDWLAHSAAIMVFAAIEARTTGKYGSRGIRYIDLEIGHAAQNVLLQAVALGLGGTPVGAFDDERVRQLLGLSREEKVLYLVPVGRPR